MARERRQKRTTSTNSKNGVVMDKVTYSIDSNLSWSDRPIWFRGWWKITFSGFLSRILTFVSFFWKMMHLAIIYSYVCFYMYLLKTVVFVLHWKWIGRFSCYKLQSLPNIELKYKVTTCPKILHLNLNASSLKSYLHIPTRWGDYFGDVLCPLTQ